MALRTKRALVALVVFVTVFLNGTGCATFWPAEEGDSGRSPWSEREIDDSMVTSQSSPETDPRETGPNWIEYAKQTRDLTPGMTMGQVRSSWGEPSASDIAGDPRLGHQRWTYTMGTHSQLATQRVIYFEAGRVVGWETH